MLGSIVGVLAVVAGVDDTTQVYAARSTLPAGTEITSADLEVAAVRLGVAGEHYLPVGALPQQGAVLTRAVQAGELVPAAAVGDRAVLGQTRVVVALSGDVAGAVQAGAAVDLWSAEQLEHGRFGPPGVLAAAEVVRLLENSSLLGGGGARSVELQLATGKVAAVLQAVANGDALSLVPASPGGAG